MRRASPTSSLLLLAAFLGSAWLGGCASKQQPAPVADASPADENNDPLEGPNRVVYAVSNGLDIVLLRPLAVTYRAVVPQVVRKPIGNLIGNLNNPTIFANDVLQGKPARAGNTFMRLLVNTTLGVGGLFDVAGSNGFPAHDNDFGLTMALWGVPSGPYLFLPVLGPSTLRDGVGYGVNAAFDPIYWPANGGGFNAFRLTRGAVGAVDAREGALDITDSIQKTSLDPYATYRSLYQQHRDAMIEQLRGNDRVNLPVKPVIGTQTPQQP